jgi:hypothetical protein
LKAGANRWRQSNPTTGTPDMNRLDTLRAVTAGRAPPIADRSKQTSFPSSAKMQPEPSFREIRVIEPRIGKILLLRCNRTGHEYPGTAIELLALDLGGLAALIKTAPTFDSNDLIGSQSRNFRDIS